MFNSYYTEPPAAVIIGQPSAKLADQLEKDEKVRIAAQVKRLGPDGLKKAEEVLEAAKAEHSQPIPTDVITSFPVPDVKSISWIPVQSLQEPGTGRRITYPPVQTPLKDHVESDGQQVPFFVEYDSVEVSAYFRSLRVLYLGRVTVGFCHCASLFFSG